MVKQICRTQMTFTDALSCSVRWTTSMPSRCVHLSLVMSCSRLMDWLNGSSHRKSNAKDIREPFFLDCQQWSLPPSSEMLWCRGQICTVFIMCLRHLLRSTTCYVCSRKVTENKSKSFRMTIGKLTVHS